MASIALEPLPFSIRDEQPRDIPAIAAVVRAAFAAMPFSDQTEHRVVDALRAENALSVSLVAEMSGAIVGHVAISPVTISDGALGWFGLGPVSVAPEHQRRGIGQALIRDALAQLKSGGACGCVVLGHPSYYGRFGFERNPALVLSGFDADHFFSVQWRGQPAAGIVTYHRSFGIDG